MNLFPFAEYWWFYAAFLFAVGIILSLDLGLFHKKEHAVSFKEATIWSIVYIVLALAFNFGFYQYSSAKFGEPVGWNLAMEFLTGFVIEYSLSIDNIFVFVLVFSYFAIPAKYQHRVLFFGILGALFFRAVFIGFGSVLMQFHWVIYLFGGFLIVTGIKMVFSSEQEIKPERNLLVRLMKKIMPVTSTRDGKNFFTKISGKYHATPLFIALIFLEFTDVVFAVDSVPAIFAVTKEPLIVFTSNIFAILGLRSMYFMLAGSVDRFHLLKYGLAVVLIFVGLKMVWLNDAFGGKFPITWSLGFILGTIVISILASLVFPKRVDIEIPHQTS
ncbi:TerC family protein [soil metagenome]